MIPLHVTAFEFFLYVLTFFLKVLAVLASILLVVWLLNRGFNWLRDRVYGQDPKQKWRGATHPTRGLVFDSTAVILLVLGITYGVCLGAAAIHRYSFPDQYMLTPERSR